MAEYQIRKPDYDEIVFPAVAAHRPRPHEDLDVLDSLLTTLEGIGAPETIPGEDGEPVATGRTLMLEPDAAVELTDAEACALHGIVRQALRRVPLTRARALTYLTAPLKALETEASVRTRLDALDERVRERKDELRRLAIEERETKQRVENLRSREARATEGDEA